MNPSISYGATARSCAHVAKEAGERGLKIGLIKLKTLWPFPDFIFDNEIIVQLHNKGFTIKEIPVETRYGRDYSSVGFVKSARYGLSIFYVLFKYLLHKCSIKKFEQFK